MYISEDDSETSLLGKHDAERLGIVQINPKGSREEVKRIRVCRKPDLEKEKKTKTPEEVKDSDQKMNDLVTEFEDIFQGIGKYRGEPVKIQMTDNVLFIIQPRRRIPLHYIQPLKEHLAKMIEQDVIEGPLSEEEEGSWISNRLLHLQHLSGIWSGLMPYRLLFDTLSEYPEPWLQQTSGSFS